MKILALDTSTPTCMVGLINGNQKNCLNQFAPMQQARLILPMIQELLEEANLSFENLDALAFGCGPGSFTGTRIATSVILGIGFARNLPVIPISSMAVLAQTAYEEWGWKKILVTLDARMSQIYAGYYVCNDEQISLLRKEQLVAPDNVPDIFEDEWYGIGDAFSVYQTVLKQKLGHKLLKINPLQPPRAEAMLTLAGRAFQTKNWVKVSEVSPTYLR